MKKFCDYVDTNILYVSYVLALITFISIVVVTLKLTLNISTIFIFVLENLLFILIGLFLFILICKRNISNNSCEIQTTIQKIRFKSLAIMIFVIIFFLLIVLKNTYYTKPLIYYILISMGISIIGIEIFFFKMSKSRSNIILLQIIAIGSVIRFSNFIIHPYVYASDPYYHYSNTIKLINTGFLSSEFGHYYFYPLHTIFNGIATIINNSEATFFLLPATISIIISIIIVYLIGKFLFSNQIGLLSALFLIFGNFYFPSPSYQPTLFGINFLLLAIYSIFKNNRKNDISWWISFWLSALGTFFVHPVNTLVLLIFLGINFTFRTIYNHFNIKNTYNKNQILRNAPFISLVIMYIGYLIFVSTLLFESLIRGIFIPDYVPPLATTASKTFSLSSTYIIETFLNYIGNTSKLFIMVIGFLLIIKKPTIERLTISILLLLLGFIPLLEVARGNFSLQSTRILLYYDVIAVFILGFGFYELVAAIKCRRSKFIFIFVCLIFMSFFSLSSYLLGDESEIISTEIPIQPLFTTDSTIASHHYLIKLPSGNNISMDYGTSSYIFGPEGRAPLILENQHVNKFDIDSFMFDPYIVINYNTMPKGTFTNSGLFKINPDTIVQNIEKKKKFSKIYTNSVIDIFFQKSALQEIII